MILLYMFVCVHLYANEVSELLACMDTPEERERG
jgi:hypothetical protein